MGVTSDRADIVKGLAVGLLLIAAMAGLFFYERAQFGEYPLSWETTDVMSERETGTLQAGQAATFTFQLEAPNALRVRAVVEWTDDVGDPDTFEVELIGPEGAGGGATSGSSSPIEHAVEVGEAPEASTAPGRDPADAREQAARFYASEAGLGTWTVTVTLVDAPGTTVPGTGVEAMGDGSNAFTLNFIVEAVEPVVGDERL